MLVTMFIQYVVRVLNLKNLKCYSKSLLQHINIRWFLLFIMYVGNICEYIYIYIYINAEGVSRTEEVTEDWQHLHIVEIPDCTHRQILSGS